MIFGKYINKYYLKYWFFFLLGAIALVVVDYFQLEIPKICGQIIDGIEDGTLFENDNKILEFMKYLGLIAFIMFAGRFTWRYCVFGCATRIESDMRFEMFKKAELLSNQFYKEHKTGALMALFTNDLNTIKESVGSGTIMFIDAIFLGSFALVRMFMVNWVLALLSLIPMLLIGGVAMIVIKVMEKKYTARQEAYSNVSDFAQENFSGIAVIKAFVKEVNEIRHFDKINDDYMKKEVDYVKYSAFLDVLLTLVISASIAILIGVGSFYVVTGFYGNEFTAGSLFEFVSYFDTLVWPFMAIANLVNMQAQAKASYNRIKELVEEPVNIVDKEIIPVDEIKGQIEFNKLNFKYPDGSNDVLHDISFTINAGEMVGIIGKTGCGKTTIVDLLLRTYNIKDNQILLDGKDIMHIAIKKVREVIGYVPQDNFLFSDTIANNIGFAFLENDQEEIENAAKLADVHSNILEFDNQYETVLGERGVTLSGGQKQRVSIARALIKNPPILIFDDSVSAVDTKTEKTIIDNLHTLRKGKTTIMIAHRISTVENLDKIIIVDEGKIIGIGNHNELIKNNPLYQEMVHLQSLEKEVNGGED